MRLLNNQHRFHVLRAGRLLPIMAACILIPASGQPAEAQSPRAKITILPESTVVRVEGICVPNRIWSFRKSYANAMDLGNRIAKLTLADAEGKDVPVRKLAPGEFESEMAASRFRYEVNLAPPQRAGDAAFVSWLGTNQGLLMLGDLLPAFSDSPVFLKNGSRDSMRVVKPMESRITVGFSLPENWTALSVERRTSQGEFEISDLGRAVFAVGRGLRISTKQIGVMSFSLIDGGDWPFNDREALDLAEKILRAHEEIFGAMPSDRAELIMMPFPVTVTPEKWSAETRGSTVTLLLGRQPSKAAAMAQLSVPLAHELFHLWVPNGLALEGDYAWFYEGFTIYEAARVAVRLQLLTFQDFLNGIGRAYDAYRAGPQSERSLVEASELRWTNGETVVYQKAMLIAFLYDLRLRLQTHSKHSLDNVYRALFAGHHSNDRPNDPKQEDRSRDGSLAALGILNEASGMQSFAQSFIERPVVLNLEAELAPFGLTVERFGSRTRVSVTNQPNRRQRDLLHELGYNDEARSSERKRSFKNQVRR